MSPKNTVTTLPHAMRAGSYATGAFISNAFASFFGIASITNTTPCRKQSSKRVGFSICGRPARRYIRNLELAVASTNTMTSNGYGTVCGGCPRSSMRYRAAARFEQAREILAKLPDGFFLWVHVITPHHPYLPDAQDQGRFLPSDEGRRLAEDPRDAGNRIIVPISKTRWIAIACCTTSSS